VGGFFGVGEPVGLVAVGLGGDRFVAEEVGAVDAIVGLALDGAAVLVAGVGGDRVWGGVLERGQSIDESW
jgi:hypothetical protein